MTLIDELRHGTNGNWTTRHQINDGWTGTLNHAGSQVNDATENVVLFDNLANPVGLEVWAVRNVAVLRPATPQNVVATAYNTTVDVTWKLNTDGITTGYNVYYATVSGGPYTQLNGAPLTANFYRHSGLTNGTTYYYIVRAVDASANLSDPSAQVSATPSTAVVTPVVDLLVTKVGNDIRLTWTNVTNSPAIVSYRIYRRTNAVLLDADVDAGLYLLATDTSGTGIYTDVGAAIGANSYTYSVRPFDGVSQATD